MPIHYAAHPRASGEIGPCGVAEAWYPNNIGGGTGAAVARSADLPATLPIDGYRMTDPEPPTHSFNPLPAVLAWIWPGLGHIALGERRRGGLIMFGVLFLFLGGVLIGGVDVVDRKQDRLWFLAQGCAGPMAWGVDWVNQGYLKRRPAAEQNRLTSIGRVNEMGTLFCALAGLMNLVVVLDVLHHRVQAPARRADDRSGEDDRGERPGKGG